MHGCLEPLEKNSLLFVIVLVGIWPAIIPLLLTNTTDKHNNKKVAARKSGALARILGGFGPNIGTLKISGGGGEQQSPAPASYSYMHVTSI